MAYTSLVTHEFGATDECSRGGADIRVHGERGRGRQQQRRRLQRGRLAPARARRAAGAASVHRPDDARRRRCTGY